MTRSSPPAGVPKILGADVELGNFVDGLDTPTGSGQIASRLLLGQITGIPASGSLYGTGAQDWGRRFLPGNGGCAYIDLDHLELALPETRSAFDFVAYWRSMLEHARIAVRRTNRGLPTTGQVHAIANCSDGQSHSYGAHTNVLVTRAAHDNLIRRKPHYLAFLTAFQASSVVFTGAGKVGAENGRPWVDFQLAQRADFFEMLVAEQTTYQRPIVNSRDEPLCGRGQGDSVDRPDLARLHSIFFDATLCQVATLLRVGTLQLVLATIEAESVDPRLALDDPLEALGRWSRDPSLSACARLVDGTAVTAVELQQLFLDRVRGCAAAHGLVARAGDILALWEETLRMLANRDFPALARRLDWVLKRQLLERAMARRRSLTWRSPELRHLDQLYASVDPDEGLFWSCEQTGAVDTIVSPRDIRRAAQEPPDDTRAWTRAHLLRLAGVRGSLDVDWDSVAVRVDTRRERYVWSERRVVHLPCPYGAGRAEHGSAFAGRPPLREVVDALDPSAAGTPVPALPVSHTVT